MVVNRLGALFLLAGLIPALLVAWLVDARWPNKAAGVQAVYAVFLLIAVGSDLVYRWRQFRERGRIRFVHPFTGGMICFVPIWAVFGLLSICLTVWLAIPTPTPKPVPPPHSGFTQLDSSQEPSWNTASSVRPG